ncbi:MAG: hypothetical protein ACK5JR_01695 [Tropicimonas sp.]|uniref:hypothetical protein n=1 Tax=Tropicimonas sp. TaxID=2067044 RepID=UPI003A863E6A
MFGLDDDMDEMTAGETAISYTDEFVDAALAKLDATFGEGYAKANPALVAGYIQACASNLGAFMTAASSVPQDGLADMFAAALEEMEDEMPAPAPKPKRRK